MENFTRENVKKMAQLLHSVEIHGTLGYVAQGVRQKHLLRLMEKAGLVRIRPRFNFGNQDFVAFRR